MKCFGATLLRAALFVAPVFAAALFVASATDAAGPLARVLQHHDRCAACGEAACNGCQAPSGECEDCDELVSVWVKETKQVEVVKHREETHLRRRVVHRQVCETVVVPEEYVDHVYHDDVRYVPRTHARTVYRTELRPHVVAVPVAERHESNCVRVWYPTCKLGEVAVDYGRYVRTPCGADLPCGGCGTCSACRAAPVAHAGSTCGSGCGGGGAGGGYGVSPRYFATPYAQAMQAIGSRYGANCGGACGGTCGANCQSGCNSGWGSNCGSTCGGGCPGYHEVWQPDIHIIKAPVPGMAYAVENRPQGVMRIVCQQTDLRVLPVRDYVYEEHLEKRATTRRIPVTRTRLVERKVYRDVPEEIEEEVAVPVPYTEVEEVEVWVRKEMPRSEAEAFGYSGRKPADA